MSKTDSLAAESLLEALGGDLCLCQRQNVPHWCEACQRRLDTIRAALRAARADAEPVVVLKMVRDALDNYFSYSPSRRDEKALGPLQTAMRCVDDALRSGGGA